jgi:GT2 family glycosyltransferase
MATVIDTTTETHLDSAEAVQSTLLLPLSSEQHERPLGLVVIGRNEGERLKRCIESLQGQTRAPMVYVDSGSTDGSVDYARSRNVITVDLDMSHPFTMGRARNAGFRALMTLAPWVEFVQFVDGDCEIDDGWIRHGADFLATHPECAVVCGHLRERFPNATVYNRLFDIETRGPFGAIDACGGVAMYRASEFARLGGFEERMIAGEEPELCLRIRRGGQGVFRTRHPMALHDADMRTFAQWWKRAMRCGHSYADRWARAKAAGERRELNKVVSCIVYGMLAPLACICGLLIAATLRAGWIGIGSVVLQLSAWLKVGLGAYRGRRSLGDPSSDSALYAGSCIVSKAPEALGVLVFERNRRAGRQTDLIEYRRGTI